MTSVFHADLLSWFSWEPMMPNDIHSWVVTGSFTGHEVVGITAFAGALAGSGEDLLHDLEVENLYTEAYRGSLGTGFPQYAVYFSVRNCGTVPVYNYSANISIVLA